MERYLVQRLYRGTQLYTMAVVTFDGPDINGNWTVEVEPFEKEIHSTAFVPGTATLVERPGKKPSIVKGMPGDKVPAPVGIPE